MKEFIEGFNENDTMFEDNENIINRDRSRFVHNVGVLAAQTREGVDRVEYIVDEGCELAKIVFKKGHEKYVNINHDSFSAIVRDIFKHI